MTRCQKAETYLADRLEGLLQRLDESMTEEDYDALFLLSELADWKGKEYEEEYL